MHITVLNTDALTCIVDTLQTDDLFPFALTCKALYASSHARAEHNRQPNATLWVTCGTSSSARIEWAVKSMGATPTGQWCSFATKKGHREALVWLAANAVPSNVPMIAPVAVHAAVAIALWGC